MRFGDRRARLPHVVDGARDRQGAAVADLVGERVAFEQLLDDERDAVGRAIDVEDDGGVHAAQPARVPRLAREALHGDGVTRLHRVEKLERDALAEADVHRLDDDTLAAFAENRTNLVFARDRLAGRWDATHANRISDSPPIV